MPPPRGPRLRLWAGAPRGKKASEGSASIRGTLYSSGHYRPTPGGAGQFCFCGKCAPSKLGAVSPSDTVTAAPAAQAREASSSGPEAHGPHGEAGLPWAPAHARPRMHAQGSGPGPGLSTRPQRERGASYGLLSGQQQWVDVLESFKLRLVNSLDYVPVAQDRAGVVGVFETWPCLALQLRTHHPCMGLLPKEVQDALPPPGTLPAPAARHPAPPWCRPYSSSGVSCTGSLVNCVSKLSRP